MTRGWMVLLLAAGCESGSGGPGSSLDDDGPLYLVATSVFGPDTTTTYLLALPSLDADVEPDYDGAVAFDNFAAAFGQPETGVFYVGDGESPEITRWRIGDEGLEPEATLSLASYGVSNAGIYPGYVAFASEERAYFLDTAQMQLIVWDPSRMETVGALELGVAPRDGLTPFAGDTMVLRDDGTLLVNVYWASYEDQRYGDAVAVVEVDTATDTVVAVHEDARCNDNYSASLAPDGTTFFSAFTTGPALRDVLGEGFGTEACLLRVVPPDGGWDEGYEVDMRALAGGRPAGELVAAADGQAFFRVFYADEAGPYGGDPNEYTAAKAAKWWRWDMATDVAEPIDGQDFGTAGGLRFGIDGRTFVTVSTADYSATTFTELSVAEGLVPGVTVRGYPYGALRLR